MVLGLQRRLYEKSASGTAPQKCRKDSVRLMTPETLRRSLQIIQVVFPIKLQSTGVFSKGSSAKAEGMLCACIGT